MYDKINEFPSNKNGENNDPIESLNNKNDILWNNEISQNIANSTIDSHSRLHSSSLCDLKSLAWRKIGSKNSKSFVDINWAKKSHK